MKGHLKITVRYHLEFEVYTAVADRYPVSRSGKTALEAVTLVERRIASAYVPVPLGSIL